MKCRALSLFGAVTIGVAGLTAGPPPADGDRPQPGAESPRAAFDGFAKGVKADRWDEAFRYLTPGSRDFLIAGLLLPAHFGMLGDDGRTLASEHADVAKLPPILEEMRGLPPDEQHTVAPKVAALVRKPAGFMTAVLDLFEKREMENWLNDLRHADFRLDRLEEEEVRATAVMRFRTENAGGSEGIAFEKVGGRWFVDYADGHGR